MSIENLKKILESESKGSGIKYDEESCIISLDDKEIGQWNNEAFRDQPEDLIWRRNISSTFHEAFQAGHEAATGRLLPLLEKAVEMANFYSSWVNMQDGIVPPGDCETMFVYEPLDKDKNGVTVGGKKAREFLEEFTNMTEIKKESV